jgi:hypothetical protein
MVQSLSWKFNKFGQSYEARSVIVPTDFVAGLFHKSPFCKIYFNIIFNQHRGFSSGLFSTRFLTVSWQRHGLVNGGIVVRFPAAVRNLYLLHSYQGARQLGRGDNQSLQSSAKLRMSGAMPPIPYMPSWRVQRQLLSYFTYLVHVPCLPYCLIYLPL